MSGGISEGSGYGRVHAHWPSTNNLTAPWGWGTHGPNVIVQGDTVSATVGSSGPESSAITQWKWAITWFEDDLSAYSDFVVEVRDACNNDEVISSDYGYDFRKRVHLRQPDIANKCPVMNVIALATPVAGASFYMADYYHSGDAEDEH